MTNTQEVNVKNYPELILLYKELNKIKKQAYQYVKIMFNEKIEIKNKLNFLKFNNKNEDVQNALSKKVSEINNEIDKDEVVQVYNKQISELSNKLDEYIKEHFPTNDMQVDIILQLDAVGGKS